MRKAATVLAGLLVAGTANAATVTVQVADETGAPVEYAVVYRVQDGVAPIAVTGEAAVDQQDKDFIPYVLAVQVGTAVSFPNNDNIRHQVYSFSPAKQFELPLYKGNPPRPVVFDKVGVVALGCNIHDWMSSYVFVANGPWFAVTDANGQAHVPNLPDGDLLLEVWHPRLKGEPARYRQPLQLGAKTPATVQFRIEQKSLLRPFRAPATLKAGY